MDSARSPALIQLVRGVRANAGTFSLSAQYVPVDKFSDRDLYSTVLYRSPTGRGKVCVAISNDGVRQIPMPVIASALCTLTHIDYEDAFLIENVATELWVVFFAHL
jgi:hypothetical protein